MGLLSRPKIRSEGYGYDQRGMARKNYTVRVRRRVVAGGWGNGVSVAFLSCRGFPRELIRGAKGLDSGVDVLG